MIVPAYRAGDTLPGCVESLLDQRFDGPFEVIVVASGNGTAPELPEDPRLSVFTRSSRLAAAAARNLGVAHARGRLLAFTDADVTAPPEWLERLCAAASNGCFVAGSVRNGTPESRIGTTEYLVAFADLHPARTEPAWHGGTGNLLVPRETWERYGPFPEHLGGCEDTLLTERAHQEGLLVYEREAAIVHHNRQRLGEVLSHQYALGAAHARLDRLRGEADRARGRVALGRAVARLFYLDRQLGRWAPSRAPARAAPAALPDPRVRSLGAGPVAGGAPWLTSGW